MNLWAFDQRSTAVGKRECPKRKAADAKESMTAGLIFGSYLQMKVSFNLSKWILC